MGLTTVTIPVTPNADGLSVVGDDSSRNDPPPPPPGGGGGSTTVVPNKKNVKGIDWESVERVAGSVGADDVRRWVSARAAASANPVETIGVIAAALGDPAHGGTKALVAAARIATGEYSVPKALECLGVCRSTGTVERTTWARLTNYQRSSLQQQSSRQQRQAKRRSKQQRPSHKQPHKQQSQTLRTESMAKTGRSPKKDQEDGVSSGQAGTGIVAVEGGFLDLSHLC